MVIEGIRKALLNKPYSQTCAEAEYDRVALMLVEPTYVDAFLCEGADHYFVQSFWSDPKLYAMFLLVCELRAAGEPVGYMKRLQTRGREILEARKNTDNTGQLGN